MYSKLQTEALSVLIGVTDTLKETILQLLESRDKNLGCFECAI